MNPTIVEGDRLLVDKHAFGIRIPFTHVHITAGTNPARGDIIVFDSPANGQSLVKRVAAIPGDTLELDGETLVINGRPASYAPGDLRSLRDLLSTTAADGPVLLTESSTGSAEHQILILPARSPGRIFGLVTVPEGMYFMLGDNCDDSADSRYIGFVPRRNIVGRAIRVVVSLNPERHFLPRPDRVLLPLH